MMEKSDPNPKELQAQERKQITIKDSANNQIQSNQRQTEDPNAIQSKMYSSAGMQSKTSEVESASTMGDSAHQASQSGYTAKQHQHESEGLSRDESQQGRWCLSKKGYLYFDQIEEYRLAQLRQIFMSIAKSRNMTCCKDTQEVVTMRGNTSNTLSYLLTLCLPFVTDLPVYEFRLLKLSEGDKPGLRASLTLLSGTQSEFNQFRKYFFYELWTRHLVALSPYETMSLLVEMNKQLYLDVAAQYRSACKLIRSADPDQAQNLDEVQASLMRNLKAIQKRIMRIGCGSKQSISTEQQISEDVKKTYVQRILMREVPVFEFYIKLEANANKEMVSQRRKITSSHTLRKVFEFLEISPDLLAPEVADQIVASVEIGKAPFYLAVEHLHELSISVSPLQNMKAISKFNSSLLQCYKAITARGVLDMDEQLPLIIYCCLLCCNNEAKGIVSLLTDYFEAEDRFEAEVRVLAALKASMDYIRAQWPLPL